jgi:hypothetical protein
MRREVYPLKITEMKIGMNVIQITIFATGMSASYQDKMQKKL